MARDPNTGDKVPKASLTLEVLTSSGAEMMCLQQLRPNSKLVAGDVEMTSPGSYQVISDDKVGLKVEPEDWKRNRYWSKDGRKPGNRHGAGAARRAAHKAKGGN